MVVKNIVTIQCYMLTTSLYSSTPCRCKSGFPFFRVCCTDFSYLRTGHSQLVFSLALLSSFVSVYTYFKHVNRERTMPQQAFFSLFLTVLDIILSLLLGQIHISISSFLPDRFSLFFSKSTFLSLPIFCLVP